jgi:hypothetical protein
MGDSQVKRDAKEYEKLAREGMDLMYPARIKGRSSRPDIKVIYHMTIMLFDTEKDTAEEAHSIASRLTMHPPDPRKITIQTSTMQGRTGYTIYNINLIGPSLKNAKELRDEFSHMGFHNNYRFIPHITVDKDTWDQLHKENGKTAFEAGIEFLPAELRQGDKIVATYSARGPHEHGSEGHLGKSEEFFYLVRETISLNPDLNKYSPAVVLSDELLIRYMQDRPTLESEVLQKHEDRLRHHFGENKEIKDFARTHTIREAYALYRKKGK